MNRTELRQEIKNLLAWDTSPNDTVANARLNEAILRGFDMLASACPSAIIPRLETISIPSATAYSPTTLSTTSDPWVLQFDGDFAPAVDKTWDKLMWLEVTLPVSTGPGRTNRYQCREFWYNSLVGKYFVSLDRPWKDGTLSALAWTLVPLYVWLPNDITTIQSVMRYGATGGALELKTITQAVTQNKVRNVFQSTSGFPSEIRRDAAQQMIAPLYAPPVEVKADTTWGNEPYGRFQYAFTYCSGYRSLNLTSPGGTPTPWQESAPSPVSAEVSVSDGTHNIKVTLPDIAWEQGFGDGATLRFSHSGIYKRVYRKRLTVGGGSNPNIESPEVFQFIADIDDRQTFFVDDGSIVPDRSVRMPERQGYFGWSLYPTPTDYTEMDFRYTIRPRRLENDADVPEFDPMYSAALCLMAASWQAYRDADASLGKHLQAEAMTSIQRLQSTQSSPTGRISRKGMGGYDTAFYPGVFRNVP